MTAQSSESLRLQAHVSVSVMPTMTCHILKAADEAIKYNIHIKE